MFGEVAVQLGHLAAAGPAPGGEEVEDDDFLADVFREFEALAAGGDEFKVRREAAQSTGWVR